MRFNLASLAASLFVPACLAAAASTIKLDSDGPRLSFYYTTDEPDTHNWAVLYAADGGRPDDPNTKHQYAAWQWALAPSGPVYIDRSKFNIKPGTYRVYVLKDGKYDILAGPVTVNLKLENLAVREAGDSLLVDYLTDKPDPTNWVVTYKDGNAPDESTKYHYYKWQYASAKRDAVRFDRADFSDGNYTAYLLAKNAYSILAGPVEIP